MKTKTLLLLCLLISTSPLGSQTLEPKLNGQDIWEKVIAYHDPNGNWNSYHGIMQEVTVFPWDYVVKETIEINRPQDYYLSTAFQEFGIIKRGMDKGKPFYSLNDDPNVPDNIRNNWGLSDKGLSMYKEWHTCLFGLPMHLKSTGMKVQERANIVDFDDRKCHELIFTGTPKSTTHENYIGRIILYVDPSDYSLHGIRWESENLPAIYIIYSNEIEINGVKIPHVMTAYNAENNDPEYTSINNPIKR